MELIFVDTSGIAAAMNAKDRHHQAARHIFLRLAEQRCVLVITNYIRAETHGLLVQRAGRQVALKFLEDRSWAVVRVEPEDEERALAILRQYSDKDFSFTDATSFAVMERLGISQAVSFDNHFRQYGWRVPEPG